MCSSKNVYYAPYFCLMTRFTFTKKIFENLFQKTSACRSQNKIKTLKTVLVECLEKVNIYKAINYALLDTHIYIYKHTYKGFTYIWYIYVNMVYIIHKYGMYNGIYILYIYINIYIYIYKYIYI